MGTGSDTRGRWAVDRQIPPWILTASYEMLCGHNTSDWVMPAPEGRMNAPPVKSNASIESGLQYVRTTIGHCLHCLHCVQHSDTNSDLHRPA